MTDSPLQIAAPTVPILPDVVLNATADVATRTHHKYGPSKLGYVELCAAYTGNSGTSEAAEQGTMLHGHMEKMIGKIAVTGGPLGYTQTLPQVRDWVVKENELTDEEVHYLRLCCIEIDKMLARKPTKIHNEIAVEIKDGDTVVTHGYLDVFMEFGNVGILTDFKFGWVPVKPASVNLQGLTYALGCFIKFPHIEKIGIYFLMPKLSWVSSHVVHRRDMVTIFERIKTVVAQAEYVQAHPEEAQKFMKAGKHCQYCSRIGNCPAQANMMALAATKYAAMPVPPNFQALEITSPEEIARLRYYVDIIEPAIEEIKRRAMEIAEANDGRISYTRPDGEVVLYEVQSRNVKRTLGLAMDVAETCKDFMSPEEVLGAAKLGLGDFLDIAKKALVNVRKGEGVKLTQKKAEEQITSLLSASGLLTSPDTKIRYLELQKQTKQIEEKKN